MDSNSKALTDVRMHVVVVLELLDEHHVKTSTKSNISIFLARSSSYSYSI
jgi:hypothetical protein